jgi:hypothetical protein
MTSVIVKLLKTTSCLANPLASKTGKHKVGMFN